MALTNDYEKKICAMYSERDAEGFVHCEECPLVVDKDAFLCKAFMHYDNRSREWVVDDNAERRAAND